MLALHPDLDPDILRFYGLMNGFELVVGLPLEPRTTYASVTRAREVAAELGGPIGALGELYMSWGMGDLLTAEFVENGPSSLRVLEVPAVPNLFNNGEDFHRDSDQLFGAVVRDYGDYFGITRSDSIARWGHGPDRLSFHAAYHARLRERAQEHPGQVWWAVRGEDHGACLREPPVLLRWSEMLALCRDEVEHGQAPTDR